MPYEWHILARNRAGNALGGFLLTSVALKAGVEPCHVLVVGGEDECAQTFCDHGEVGVNHVGGFRISGPASTINPLSVENGIGPLKMLRADGTLHCLPRSDHVEHCLAAAALHLSEHGNQDTHHSTTPRSRSFRSNSSPNASSIISCLMRATSVGPSPPLPKIPMMGVRSRGDSEFDCTGSTPVLTLAGPLPRPWTGRRGAGIAPCPWKRC